MRVRVAESVCNTLRVISVAIVLLFSSAINLCRAGDLPNTPPDAWWWYYGQSPEMVTNLLNKNDGRLESIQVEQTSPLLFTIAMVKNTGAYAKTWWWYYGQSEADINNLAKTLNARVTNLDAYEVGGNTNFAAIFVSNTGADARSWWWYFGQTPTQIGSLVQEHNARLIDLRQYSAGGSERYAVVMVENAGPDATAWWGYYNVTSTQVASELENNGAYLVSLQISNPSSSTFNVVMEKLPTPGDVPWWWYFGESPWQLSGLLEYNEAWLTNVKTYQLNGRRVFTAVMLGFPRGRQAVSTYHYDNNRTGWNYNEPTLNATNVASAQFALRHTVSLDDQVDAQPLVIPGLASVGGKSTNGHDVVYVATESNTVSAVDASTGQILAQRNLGAPVPMPLGCNNNAPNVGINGTPVIELGEKTMYLVTYGLESGEPVHRIHALDITTLADRMPSVVVKASHTLSNGQTYSFDSQYQRQRSGLLAANGNIYVGFASFCDFKAGYSRGWVLGWTQSTLAPLAHNELTNSLPPPTSKTSFFLTSNWMSGYGLAADSSGNVYAVTGNSGTNTYNNVDNLSESVVKLSGDLSKLESFFTPSNVNALDAGDTDFGSGGALVLPQQDGGTPRLVAAAGKDGRLFILNADSLGAFTSGGPDKDVTEQAIGGCWCGPSYFMQPGGGVIVGSGGTTVTLWGVQTSSGVALGNLGESQSIYATDVHDPGFFTTVSSFGAETGVVIWAVARDDQSSKGSIYLDAFSEKRDTSNHLTLLKRLQAGSWDSPNGPNANPNIVPVVANGRVFVASNKKLEIFGLE
jgi:hypothetical protein